jgi:hypothetical protein
MSNTIIKKFYISFQFDVRSRCFYMASHFLARTPSSSRVRSLLLRADAGIDMYMKDIVFSGFELRDHVNTA